MSLFKFNKKVDLYNFVKFLNKYKSTNTLPNPYDWPDKISLDSQTWEHITTIRRYTTEENRERQITMFWAEGDVVATSYVRGQETSVSAKHSANLQYTNTTRPEYFRKQITVDGKIVKDYTISKNKVPPKPEVISLFTVHTHPKRQSTDGNYYYNFFSATDINSLTESSALCIGLMIDKLWLMCKTNRTNVTPESQQRIDNIAYNFTQNEVSRVEELRKISEEAGLVFYTAKANGPLVKI